MATDAAISPVGASSLAQYARQQYDNEIGNHASLFKKWNDNRYAYLKMPLGRWAPKAGTENAWRSKTMPGQTKSKVVTAVVLIIDSILQNGDITFALDPSQAQQDRLGIALEEIRTSQRERIDEAENNIKRDLKATNVDREIAKMALSDGIYGEAICKLIVETVASEEYELDPVEGIDDPTRIPEELQTWSLKTETRKANSAVYRSIWQIVRDREDDNPMTCAHIFDWTFSSPDGIRDKMGEPGYIDSQIKSVLSANKSNPNASPKAESTGSDNMDPALRDKPNVIKTIFNAEMWGRVLLKDVLAFEAQMKGEQPVPIPNSPTNDDDSEMVECMLELADDKIIKFTRVNPKERPYRIAVCESALDDNHGIGVADNTAEEQEVITTTTRDFIDNKKLVGDVILGMKEELLINDFKKVHPGARIGMSEECKDINDAIMSLDIKDTGESLMSLLAMANEQLSENSMIPEEEQGVRQAGSDTAFAVSQRLEKAGKYMGDVIRHFDEGIIEPMISWMHKRNMANPDLRTGKGDFVVTAKGYTSYLERVLRIQKLTQWLNMVISDPELRELYKINEIIDDIGKSLEVNVAKYHKTKESLFRKSENEAAANAAQAEAAQELAQAELELKQAETNLKNATASEKSEKTKIDKLKAIVEAKKVAVDKEKNESVNVDVKKTTTATATPPPATPPVARPQPVPVPEVPEQSEIPGVPV